MFDPRFLVVSLGNPAPYHESLHSAGHRVLKSLQRRLGPHQPAFANARLGGASAASSAGTKYVLAQSPTLMNVSGPWVAKAWRQTLAASGGRPGDLGLVIIHDDLEQPLGAVRLRDWGRSHRGQNGVKSVSASLRQAEFAESRWARIAVGIGRPEQRDRSTVSDYVLRPMTRDQVDVLDAEAAPRVLEALLALEREWAAEVEAGTKA